MFVKTSIKIYNKNTTSNSINNNQNSQGTKGNSASWVRSILIIKSLHKKWIWSDLELLAL